MSEGSIRGDCQGAVDMLIVFSDDTQFSHGIDYYLGACGGVIGIHTAVVAQV